MLSKDSLITPQIFQLIYTNKFTNTYMQRMVHSWNKSVDEHMKVEWTISYLPQILIVVAPQVLKGCETLHYINQRKIKGNQIFFLVKVGVDTTCKYKSLKRR